MLLLENLLVFKKNSKYRILLQKSKFIYKKLNVPDDTDASSEEFPVSLYGKFVIFLNQQFNMRRFVSDL